MIWESAPWKDELLKDANLLERWAEKTSRRTQREYIFEKKIFLAAYAIRKLFEADKVCTTLHEKPMPCLSYPRTESTVTPWNLDHVDRHFLLEASVPARLGVTALINQIIHSHIFMLSVNEKNHVDGFLVSSRQGKKQRLFGVALKDFCGLMREIGNDYPNYSRTSHNIATGRYDTVKTCPIHRGEDKLINEP